MSNNTDLIMLQTAIKEIIEYIETRTGVSYYDIKEILGTKMCE